MIFQLNKIKEEIISMLIEHSRIIYSVLSDMGVFYNRWAENYEKHKSSLEKKKSKMQLSEEDADGIKDTLMIHLVFEWNGHMAREIYNSLLLSTCLK